MGHVAAGLTRVPIDGQTLCTLMPSPDPEGEDVSQVLRFDADRPAGPVDVRCEAVGPAATVRLREVRCLLR